jgi:hypothetical protein
MEQLVAHAKCHIRGLPILEHICQVILQGRLGYYNGGCIFCPMRHDQGFFCRLVFFTGGNRNFRLPRNLENLANLPDEIIQTNFEFEFFNVKTHIFDTKSQ